MSGWKEYTGSDEQIAEILDCVPVAYIVKWPNGIQSDILRDGDHDHIYDYGNPSHYLICNPHPLADMICEQARTGQPVWIKTYRILSYSSRYEFVEARSDCSIYKTTEPNWSIPKAEYSFTPFED
jgi:hypothetical protein